MDIVCAVAKASSTSDLFWIGSEFTNLKPLNVVGQEKFAESLCIAPIGNAIRVPTGRTSPS